MTIVKRFIIIGLDCLAPQLIFEKFKDDLPFFGKLRKRAKFGTLESTIPAITCPAWNCMMTSSDPGMMGVYGFRNRSGYGYDELAIANSSYVNKPLLWDVLAKKGLSSVLLNVPQTYPPKPIKGYKVCAFLTPGIESDFTYPVELKQELLKAVPDYMIDVAGFRTDNKEWLLKEIYKMSKARFKATDFLLKTKPWDFFMVVFMGPDRLHHGFWKYFDPVHPLYTPGHLFQNVMRKYYMFLDRQIEQTLKPYLDENTGIMFVSDHGAQAMQGGFFLNEWLIKEGYLILKQKPAKSCKLTTDMIDWKRTKAWGAGGYYGRIFLNVKGREPSGLIKQNEVNSVLQELKTKLESLNDDDAKPMGNRAFFPHDIYREVNRIPPDIILYLGNLTWRSQGTIGSGELYTHENDTGPDDANHAQNGFYLLYHPSIKEPRYEHQRIYDIAPTICDALGMEKQDSFIGTSFWNVDK